MAVWPENWDIFRAFVASWTQWDTRAIVSPFGTGGIYYSGLRYEGVRAGLKGDGFKITPKLWAGIRTMEAAAMAALNER